MHELKPQRLWCCIPVFTFFAVHTSREDGNFYIAAICLHLPWPKAAVMAQGEPANPRGLEGRSRNSETMVNTERGSRKRAASQTPVASSTWPQVEDFTWLARKCCRDFEPRVVGIYGLGPVYSPYLLPDILPHFGSARLIRKPTSGTATELQEEILGTI